MMFKSLKLYQNQHIDLAEIQRLLAEFGYRRQDAVSEEGEFASRGSILDIFPLTFEMPVRVQLEFDEIKKISNYDLAGGSTVGEHQIIIILPVRSSHKTRLRTLSEEFPAYNFLDLTAGDFVVHIKYGIGRFCGKERIRVGEIEVEHLALEYADKEKLLVPISEAHLIQKYLSFAHRRPKLNRLGGLEWQRIKEKTKKGIARYAQELLHIESMRLMVNGFQFSADGEWVKEFEKTFPYQETVDQKTAWKDARSDMESPRPMDRLICGEVGYGKTEIAMRAAVKAVSDNKQVALLVPTTILAEQHFQNFFLRLKKLPIRVEMLSRFKTAAQRRAILEGLALGQVDIIIGTHALLGDEIRFKDLGLVIIDEEQRFGVKAKEKLKHLRFSVDVLTLTATPIPRTLYMSLMGVKNMSQVNTPPQNRMPILTYVVEYDSNLIKQAIMREINRGGQVYFVHNHVSDIEAVKKRVSALLPPAIRLAVAHGQMPSRLLEAVMMDFIRGKADILFSTSIIESGIDIPNVNTLIVNNADRFGLADLHQLRGRVGRFNRQAYAYFVTPKNTVLSAESHKRLAALETYSGLSAGFSIAMEDLEIRGAGNLLGTEQHGFIMAVGFDLYCRLLRQAIANYRVIAEDERHNNEHTI